MFNPSSVRCFTVAEVCDLTGASQDRILREIATGALPARRLGRRSVIIAADVERWLKKLPPLIEDDADGSRAGGDE